MHSVKGEIVNGKMACPPDPNTGLGSMKLVVREHVPSRSTLLEEYDHAALPSARYPLHVGEFVKTSDGEPDTGIVRRSFVPVFPSPSAAVHSPTTLAVTMMAFLKRLRDSLSLLQNEDSGNALSNML